MNLENSQDYYGKVLAGSSDLKTDACCTMEAPPAEIMSALRNVHEEVKARYYGCGLVAPQAIAGCHVLDLGSGSGSAQERAKHSRVACKSRFGSSFSPLSRF